jgi:hypothetical protein
MQLYRVVFKSNFNSARVLYTISATNNHDAKNKAIALHMSHEVERFSVLGGEVCYLTREDFSFYFAIRLA